MALPPAGPPVVLGHGSPAGGLGLGVPGRHGGAVPSGRRSSAPAAPPPRRSGPGPFPPWASGPETIAQARHLARRLDPPGYLAGRQAEDAAGGVDHRLHGRGVQVEGGPPAAWSVLDLVMFSRPEAVHVELHVAPAERRRLGAAQQAVPASPAAGPGPSGPASRPAARSPSSVGCLGGPAGSAPSPSLRPGPRRSGPRLFPRPPVLPAQPLERGLHQRTGRRVGVAGQAVGGGDRLKAAAVRGQRPAPGLHQMLQVAAHVGRSCRQAPDPVSRHHWVKSLQPAT